MKKIIANILYRRAKSYVNTCEPIIIAVTGSHGKTTTKNAIGSIIKEAYPDHLVRIPEKSFNNEFGTPLTVLGEKSPGRSIVGWFALIIRSFFYRKRSCPEILVLEYGADRPGEIEHWCKMAAPDIGVITGISEVHASNYPNLDELIKEKSQLAVYTKQVLCLNADDDAVMSMQEKIQQGVDVYSYGYEGATCTIKKISVQPNSEEMFEPGEMFVVTLADATLQKENVEIRLNNLFGYAPIMSAAAALTAHEGLRSVKNSRTLTSREALEALTVSYTPTPGRLRPIAGIKGSLLIDDSYNAAPAATMNGLDILDTFPLAEEQDRRIAVLGRMAELGEHSDQRHFDIGKRVAEVADTFIAVGEEMKVATGAARQFGMNDDAIEWFSTSEEAGRYLDRYVKQGDIVYIKGSQSARMEKVVKDLMAEPLRSKELLVRQEKKWLCS